MTGHHGINGRLGTSTPTGQTRLTGLTGLHRLTGPTGLAGFRGLNNKGGFSMWNFPPGPGDSANTDNLTADAYREIGSRKDGL